MPALPAWQDQNVPSSSLPPPETPKAAFSAALASQQNSRLANLLSKVKRTYCPNLGYFPWERGMGRHFQAPLLDKEGLGVVGLGARPKLCLAVADITQQCLRHPRSKNLIRRPARYIQMRELYLLRSMELGKRAYPRGDAMHADSSPGSGPDLRC